jgi:hypothetical protein
LGFFLGIPYQAIGIGLGFLLGIWAFIEADTVKGRAFIGTTMITIFILPVVWRRPAAGMVSFICWIFFGLGCYIFLKWRGEFPWR